jgi:hypothetical protein
METGWTPIYMYSNKYKKQIKHDDHKPDSKGCRKIIQAQGEIYMYLKSFDHVGKTTNWMYINIM